MLHQTSLLDSRLQLDPGHLKRVGTTQSCQTPVKRVESSPLAAYRMSTLLTSATFTSDMLPYGDMELEFQLFLYLYMYSIEAVSPYWSHSQANCECFRF